METREVSENKKKEVKDFLELLDQYPIIGILNLENMPSAQFQKMRSSMRDGVLIRMTKKRLLKIIFGQSKVKGIEKLTEKLVGMPAILFTKDNPFKLYKIIKKSKTPAAAKPGSISPRDITIPAGPTQFAPGPIISELGAFGLKAGVVEGKIEIKEDKTVVEEGGVITDKLVALFAKFAILPMEIGLDLVCVLEDGVIYDKKVLDVDESKFISDITQAAAWAFNLSVEAAIPTKDNIELLLGNVFKNSKAVALESNFMADLVAEELVSKAERQMMSLKSEANISTEAPAKKEETKVEEKPEEAKVEEKPAEEPKIEETSKEETKVEEPKVEETSKEEAKVEEPVEETPKAEEPKVEEKAEEVVEVPVEEKEEVKETPKEEPVEEDVTELKEKVEDDIEKVEEALPNDIQKAEEKIEDLNPAEKEEAEKEIESVKKVVEQGISEAEKAIKEEEKVDDIVKDDTSEMRKAEELAQELVKKGTLRDVPSARELAEKKKPKKQDDVPSAHELAKSKKKL